jgi:hypothetical protein
MSSRGPVAPQVYDHCGPSECFRQAILARIIIFDVGALPIENSISRKPHAYRESAPWCILAPGDDQHLAGSIQSQTSRHRRSANDCKP